jgi:hypothetical protein
MVFIEISLRAGQFTSFEELMLQELFKPVKPVFIKPVNSC